MSPRWTGSVQLLFQGSVGFSELDVETTCAQQVAHSKNYLLAIEGLGQEVIRTEKQRAVPGGPTHITCEHDHWKKAEALASAPQIPQDFETVRRRHMEVQQNDVRFKFSERALDLIRIGEALDRARLICEERLQHVDVVSRIVTDQYPVPDDRSSAFTHLTANEVRNSGRRRRALRPDSLGAKSPQSPWRRFTLIARESRHAQVWAPLPCKQRVGWHAGAEGIRTPDLLTASQPRSQLRHGPTERLVEC